MDEDDAQYYNDQIEHFEETSDSLTHLLRQQLTVVQATLGTVNETLSDIVHNEDRLREWLKRLKQYVNIMVAQYGNATNSLSVKLVVEEHIARALDAISAVQRNLVLIVDSIGKAQKGILQPLIITPDYSSMLLFEAIQLFPRTPCYPSP
jgi:predicted nuclease with TOPRIM domain